MSNSQENEPESGKTKIRLGDDSSDDESMNGSRENMLNLSKSESSAKPVGSGVGISMSRQVSIQEPSDHHKSSSDASTHHLAPSSSTSLHSPSSHVDLQMLGESLAKANLARGISHLEQEVAAVAKGGDIHGSHPIPLNQHPETEGAYHTMTVASVASKLATDYVHGLSQDEATARLEKYGYNELGLSGGVSAMKVLLSNLFNAMNLVLVLAFIVSAAAQDWIEAIVLVIVIITNTLIGFFQEYNSEKTMDALNKLSSPTVRLMRAGELGIESSTYVVPGDLVFLEEGDQVAADLRLVQSVNLEIDEALLTGEPYPIKKKIPPVSDPLCALGDRINIAFKNTTVTKGRGYGIAIYTGLDTEIGKIAVSVAGSGPQQNESTSTVEGRKLARFRRIVNKIRGTASGGTKTALQQRLDKLMFSLLGLAIGLAFIVFAANSFSGDSQVVLYAIAVAIAILPEGLPAVITVTMALGVRKMAQQKALVRKLASLESLGEVSNICSDKTGTITQGKMVVTEGWFSERNVEVTGNGLAPEGIFYPIGEDTPISVAPDAIPPYLRDVAMVSALCNGSGISKSEEEENLWTGVGDPTEIALTVFSYKAGFKKPELEKGLEFITELPFDSVLKRMTVVYRKKTELLVLMKGATESVVSCCDAYQTPDGILPLTQDYINNVILKQVDALASKGLRVLSLAHNTRDVRNAEHPTLGAGPTGENTPASWSLETRNEIETKLTFIGLIGMYDPPRPDSAQAVLDCYKAGIVVHMATGDHPSTAKAIAIQVNIITQEQIDMYPGLVMVARDFDRMTENQLDNLDELPRVLARCSPASKVKLIEALHRRGKKVAMTGDGVNDAPAVKNADIGIAMGLGGSDVTKQASDIVLTDDNFATILRACGEGRRIFSNISKFVVHLMTGNTAEVVALIIGLSIVDSDNRSVFVMSPIQILWLNMLTSSPPALGLGVEPASADIMEVPPRDPQVGLFTKEVIVDLFVYGTIMGALTLGQFGLVVFEYGSGAPDGIQCNVSYQPACDHIFRARATTFVSMSMLLLVHAFNCRHPRTSIFKMNILENKPLIWFVLLGCLLIIPTPYIPGLNKSVLYHAPISWEWLTILVAMIIFLIASEIYKWFKRTYWPLASGSSASSVQPSSSEDRPREYKSSNGEINIPLETLPHTDL